MDNRNEIKKMLYREKPMARLVGKDNEKYFYRTNTSTGVLSFVVPISDMGEKLFQHDIEAQFLIRWLNV